jgi:hypothetical protein
MIERMITLDGLTIVTAQIRCWQVLAEHSEVGRTWPVRTNIWIKDLPQQFTVIGDVSAELRAAVEAP